LTVMVTRGRLFAGSFRIHTSSDIAFCFLFPNPTTFSLLRIWERIMEGNSMGLGMGPGFTSTNAPSGTRGCGHPVGRHEAPALRRAADPAAPPGSPGAFSRHVHHCTSTGPVSSPQDVFFFCESPTPLHPRRRSRARAPLPWGSRWSAGRGLCSWTSPPAAWTPPPAATSGPGLLLLVPDQLCPSRNTLSGPPFPCQGS